MDFDNSRRREISKYYRENIKSNIVLPEAYCENSHVWHIFAIRCKNRDSLQNYLSMNGIETNIHYPCPPHLQKAYDEWKLFSFPITERIHKEELSLPISPVLSDSEVEYVVDVINKWNG